MIKINDNVDKGYINEDVIMMLVVMKIMLMMTISIII